MSGYEIAVDVKNLAKKFPGTDALVDVSVQIPKGQICGLLGPNGSGKSTLLKCLMGFFKPSKGHIELFERPLKPSEMKKDIAYLPEVDSLYRWMNVQQTLNFFAAFYDDWQEERAQELLDFMHLEKENKVATLSKGMRARLKLVTVLARSAKLVLLDEPLSGIDPSSRGRIVEAIAGEFRNCEQTMIISTHEVGETESLFDSVMFLEKGTVRLRGEAEELRSQHNLSIRDLFREVFL